MRYASRRVAETKFNNSPVMEVRPTLERDTIVSVEKESFLALNAESFRVYLEALSMDELADLLTRYEHDLSTQQRGLVAEVIAAYDTRSEEQPQEPARRDPLPVDGAFPPPTPTPANPPQCILTFLNYVGRFCPRPALNPTPLGIFCFRESFNSEV